MSGSGIRSDAADSTGRLLRGGSIYTVATAAQLGAGLLVLPLLTRVLDADQYGTVTAALVIYNLLGVSIGLGLPAAMSRAFFHADDRDFGREGTLGLIWVTALAALGCALVLELTGPAWSALYEEVGYGWPLRLAVWSAVAFAVLQASQSILRAEERPRPYVVGAVIATVGAQSAGLAGAAIWGVTGYMAGVAAGALAASAFAVVSTGAHRRIGFHGGVARRNLRIGVPIVPHALALYILAAGDRVVVERLEGLDGVARYHVAYLVGFVVIMLGAALNNAWSPIVFGASDERRWSVLADTAATVMRISALAVASVAILAPLALEVAAPADYRLDGLSEVTVLVALSAIPFVWYQACAHVILWRATTWWFALTTPVVAAVNIGLNFALIPDHGLTGAAVATLASYMLLATAMVIITRGSISISWPWRSAAISAGIALGACGLALALPEDGAWLALRGLAGIGVAALIALMVLRSPRPARPPEPQASAMA